MVLLDSFGKRDTEVSHRFLTMTLNNAVCSSSPCHISHVEQDDGASSDMTLATDMEVCMSWASCRDFK